MQQLVYTLRLDMKDTGIINTGLRLKQGDSGMKIVVNVYNGGQNAFDAGSTPKIVFRRPDGASVQADMTVETSSYSYVLVGNELQVPGKELMDVKFTINSDDRESTITCCFDVVADTITPNTGGSGIYDNDLAVLVDQANTDASNAIVAAADAEDSAEDSEAWAVGERNGVPVTSGDETYENNAKYWANQANPTVLANMSDVDITSPTDNQVLQYDANSGMWVNRSASGSGDMKKSVYDSASTVENAGGIVPYVASQIPTVDQVYDGTSANAQSGVAVASAITNKVDKTQITNPNLLDNPWFTVNQRGSASYSTAGYTVDRWAMLGGAINYTLTIGSVNLTPLQNVYQPLDATTYGQFDNTQYTFSAIIDDVLETWTFTAYGDGTQHQQTSATSKEIVFNFIENWGVGIHLAGFDLYPVTKAHTIKAVKLEKGSISTLALDTAPNYATELLKCQRYYINFAPLTTSNRNGGASGAKFSDLNGCSVAIPIPIAMRTKPTISIVEYGTMYFGDGTTENVASVSVDDTFNNVVRFWISVSALSGVASNVIWYDYNFSLSADL